MKRSEIDALPLEGDVSFRERQVEPGRTALLLIDLQKGEYNERKIKAEPEHAYFWNRLARVVIPNGQKLLAACRGAGVEVLFTTVECYTLDGRDRSLDYKVSGIFAAKGSWEAEVIDELKPMPNEISIPKMSSSVFMSTNIEYVLRNLGIEFLMVMGVVTDQCVEFGGTRRLRPGLSRHAHRGRLRDDDSGAPRRNAEGDQGLLPTAQDGPGSGRASQLAQGGGRVDGHATRRGSATKRRCAARRRRKDEKAGDRGFGSRRGDGGGTGQDGDGSGRCHHRLRHCAQWLDERV